MATYRFLNKIKTETTEQGMGEKEEGHENTGNSSAKVNGSCAKDHDAEEKGEELEGTREGHKEGEMKGEWGKDKRNSAIVGEQKQTWQDNIASREKSEDMKGEWKDGKKGEEEGKEATLKGEGGSEGKDEANAASMAEAKKEGRNEGEEKAQKEEKTEKTKKDEEGKNDETLEGWRKRALDAEFKLNEVRKELDDVKKTRSGELTSNQRRMIEAAKKIIEKDRSRQRKKREDKMQNGETQADSTTGTLQIARTTTESPQGSAKTTTENPRNIQKSTGTCVQIAEGIMLKPPQIAKTTAENPRNAQTTGTMIPQNAQTTGTTIALSPSPSRTLVVASSASSAQMGRSPQQTKSSFLTVETKHKASSSSARIPGRERTQENKFADPNLGSAKHIEWTAGQNGMHASTQGTLVPHGGPNYYSSGGGWAPNAHTSTPESSTYTASQWDRGDWSRGDADKWALVPTNSPGDSENGVADPWSRPDRSREWNLFDPEKDPRFTQAKGGCAFLLHSLETHQSPSSTSSRASSLTHKVAIDTVYLSNTHLTPDVALDIFKILGRIAASIKSIRIYDNKLTNLIELLNCFPFSLWNSVHELHLTKNNFKDADVIKMFQWLENTNGGQVKLVRLDGCDLTRPELKKYFARGTLKICAGTSTGCKKFICHAKCDVHIPYADKAIKIHNPSGQYDLTTNTRGA